MSYKACMLSSRYSFGGGARDRLVSAQTFTGGSTSKCLNKKKSNAQIEISINWCKHGLMEKGHEPMSLHRHHCRFLQLLVYSPVLIMMQSEKNPHEGDPRAPLEWDLPLMSRFPVLICATAAAWHGSMHTTGNTNSTVDLVLFCQLSVIVGAWSCSVHGNGWCMVTQTGINIKLHAAAAASQTA